MTKVIKVGVAGHIWGRVKHKAMTKHYLGTHITERQKETEVHADMKFNFFENASLLCLGIFP